MIVPQAIKRAIATEYAALARSQMAHIAPAIIWGVHIDNGTRGPPQTMLIDFPPHPVASFVHTHYRGDFHQITIIWRLSRKQNRAFIVPFISQIPTGTIGTLHGTYLYIIPGSIRANHLTKE